MQHFGHVKPRLLFHAVFRKIAQRCLNDLFASGRPPQQQGAIGEPVLPCLYLAENKDILHSPQSGQFPRMYCVHFAPSLHIRVLGTTRSGTLSNNSTQICIGLRRPSHLFKKAFAMDVQHTILRNRGIMVFGRVTLVFCKPIFRIPTPQSVSCSGPAILWQGWMPPQSKRRLHLPLTTQLHGWIMVAGRRLPSIKT